MPSGAGGKAAGAGSSSGAGPAAGASQRVSVPRSAWVKLQPRSQPTFVFRVRRGGAIKFSVRQVAPVCRRVGSFTIRVHPGTNRLRFSGSVRGHRLRAGTYVIRARRGKATIYRKILVVGESSPAANTCAGGGYTPFGGGAAVGGDSTASGGSTSGAKDDHARSNAEKAVSEPRASGVLGAQASKVLPASGKAQLGLLIVLAAAIFLLGLGTLPVEVIPHPAAAAFIARRRAVVAAGGLAALAAFLVAYFV